MNIFELPVENVPAQEFNIIIGNKIVVLRIKTAGTKGGVFMDLSIDGAVVFSGLQCKSNVDILEAFRWCSLRGALFFYNDDDSVDLHIDQCGKSVKLYYATI